MYSALIKNKDGKIIDCFNFSDKDVYNDFLNTTDSVFKKLGLTVEERTIHVELNN